MRLRHLVVCACVLVPGAVRAAERPGPLADEAGCKHYRGTSSGNDPSVRLDVVLCAHPDGTRGKVDGKVQWSSLLSGWNLRHVEGRWSAGTLTMRDVEILDEKPESGFRFCTIDAYVLAQDSTGVLKGSYDSEACSDHAQMTLRAVDAPGGHAVAPPKASDRAAADPLPDPTPDPLPSPLPNPLPSPPPHPPRAADLSQPPGCGCDVSLLVLLPIFGVGRARRV